MVSHEEVLRDELDCFESKISNEDAEALERELGSD